MRHIGTVTTKPRWKDPGTCKDCVYLGEFGLYDLYCCTKPDHPTVIATCEADDGNYKSRIVIAPYDPELGEALRRATKEGKATRGGKENGSSAEIAQAERLRHSRWAADIRPENGLAVPEKREKGTHANRS